MTARHNPDYRHHQIDIGAYQAWLFDLDGVLTKTAAVHAAAWKQAFDEFLDEEASRSKKAFAPFDPVHDYERYVDGEPREDGVRNFLASRNITLPEGTADDAPGTRSINGLGNRKNDLVLDVLRTKGIATYDGAIALVRALRAQGTAVGVVSASENTQAVLLAAGIADLFDARVDGHVVKDRHLAGKPAPDSYLEGARVLGADPGRAVVVEDALAGVEAGRAGHFALVVGVDHHDDADEHDYADELYAHGADVVVRDLGELLSDRASRVDRSNRT
jgi:beta-phosphoglucomutase family hydrolase